MQGCTAPTEKAAPLPLARFLFNGLNYQGRSLPLLVFLSLSLSLSCSFPRTSCLRPSSGYLLGFYLWSRSQCNRPIWTGARSNFPIIVGLLGRTKLLPLGTDGGPVSVKEAKHSG